MVKMVWLISILTLLVCSTAKAQELIPLHDPTVSTPPLNGGQAVAVQVAAEHLMNVSSSVLTAETWLRNYVLPFYPSTNVTTILVGHSLLCDGDQKHQLLGFIPPALKNIHHSLTRWGLQNHIKPTTSFSSSCLSPDSDFGPLLTATLREIGSPHVVISGPRTDKHTSRKLLSTNALSPLPPLLGTISPAPDALPPFMATPPPHLHLPPCEPSRSAPPAHQHNHGLWCVAKPSVPPETLQEALDFACGEGGADCEAIGQDGSCYYPDTVNAHASYAFNSYWQKNKMSGGSCGFGGTAMLIASDPSYSHCRFTLA